MAQPIGKVTHYYGKPHAVVIDLAAPLQQGERVTFDRGEMHFTQVANSMQLDHVPIEKAKSGMNIGLKVDEPVKPGATVYRGEAP